MALHNLADWIRNAAPETLESLGLHKKGEGAGNPAPVIDSAPPVPSSKPRLKREDFSEASTSAGEETPRQRGAAKPRKDDLEDREMMKFKIMTDELAATNSDANKWFHVPNGGKRDIKIGRNGKSYSPTGVKLKKMGARKGIVDVFFLSPRGNYIGFVADMKMPGNKLTEEQSEWMIWFGEQGFYCVVAYSADEMYEEFRAYIEGERVRGE